MNHNKKFVLIGLPGSGKTTILNKIAIQEHLEVVSSDIIIDSALEKMNDTLFFALNEKLASRNVSLERNKIQSVVQIIAEYGEEPVFRDIEEYFVKKIISEINNNQILDLGGKAFMRPKVRQALKDENYLSAYLNLTPSDIIDRLSSTTERNKRANLELAGKDWTTVIHSMYMARHHIYSMADVSIEISGNMTIQQVLDKINKELTK